MSGTVLDERPVEHEADCDDHAITHVARDPDERPLVALCGKRASNSEMGTYRGNLPETALPCVVCLELREGVSRHV